MRKAWKNERGMTLLELMAAVVILVLVAIPLTSIGTTVYRWHKEDEQRNRAVLVAEQRMLELKNDLEVTGWTADEEQAEIDPISKVNLQTLVKMRPRTMNDADGNSILVYELIDVQVEVRGPDLERPTQQKTLTTLVTTIRKKSRAGGTP